MIVSDGWNGWRFLIGLHIDPATATYLDHEALAQSDESGTLIEWAADQTLNDWTRHCCFPIRCNNSRVLHVNVVMHLDKCHRPHPRDWWAIPMICGSANETTVCIITLTIKQPVVCCSNEITRRWKSYSPMLLVVGWPSMKKTTNIWNHPSADHNSNYINKNICKNICISSI